MGKVLFFDVDGTLVDYHGKMPGSAKQALEQVRKNGHRTVLCSGRSRMQIYPWLMELGFDGIVAATGAYVECGGKVVYTHSMPGEVIRMVVDLLDEAGACYSAQARNRMVATAPNLERQMAKFRAMGVKDAAFEQIWGKVQVEEHMERVGDIEKLLYHESRFPVREIRKRLLGVCDVTESSFENPQEDAGEITCRGINKAWGMQKYIEHAEIAREDTIAFGDGPNDFDMLEFAAVGVAMGNADERLKRLADYVTTRVDEDGIAHAMRKMKLI